MDIEVKLASALYVKPGVQLKPDFRQTAVRSYNATVCHIDPQAPGGPEQPINEYVSNQTNGYIQNMLQSGSIQSDTALLLIDTLLFNGTWQRQFNKDLTRPENFEKLDGFNVTVETMKDIRPALYKRDDANKVDVLQLKFRNQRFALYVALPQEKDGLPRLESLIRDQEKYEQLFQNLQNQTVDVKLPKLRIESAVRLEQALAQQGMPTAFDKDQADFSGISDDGRLYISRVDHKAVLEVQELGTIAAAATSVEINTLSAATVNFHALHPYLLILRDDKTRQVLFQARYNA